MLLRVFMFFTARYRHLNDLDETISGINRYLAASLNNVPSDAPSEAFLTEPLQHIRDFIFTGTGQPLRRGLALCLIHPHIERTSLSKGKASLSLIQLR